MSASRIDRFILESVGPSWKKVARVIADVMAARELDFPDAEDVAERVEALVHNGHLEAKGDIKKWRHSEIRRP
jgi:hypothetical protein